MLSVFSKINVQECDSTFDSRIFLFASNDHNNFLETHKGVSSLFSQSQMKPHLILMCMYHLSHIWVFLIQVSYIWSQPKSFSFDILRIERSSCPAVAFSFLFFSWQASLCSGNISWVSYCPVETNPFSSFARGLFLILHIC